MTASAPAFDRRLLELLVCPVSKASLVFRQETLELWCSASGLAYPVRDGIPVMLPDEARELTPQERESLRGRPSAGV